MQSCETWWNVPSDIYLLIIRRFLSVPMPEIFRTSIFGGYVGGQNLKIGRPPYFNYFLITHRLVAFQINQLEETNPESLMIFFLKGQLFEIKEVKGQN